MHIIINAFHPSSYSSAHCPGLSKSSEKFYNISNSPGEILSAFFEFEPHFYSKERVVDCKIAGLQWIWFIYAQLKSGIK